MQFPLGSGLFGVGSADPNQQLMTQFPSYPLIRKPRTPLGSGMFDTEAEQPPSDFQLGSGLFGQQMPQPNIQQGGPTTPPTQQQPAPGGGETPTWDQKFGAMLNNPAFQFGLSLLGSSHSANPWGTALQTALNAQMASANSKRQQTLAEQDKRRVDIEEKGLGLREKGQQQAVQEAALDRALKERQLANETEQQRFQREFNERKLAQDQAQFDAGAPLRDAQAGYYGAQSGALFADTGVKRDTLNANVEQKRREMDFVQGLFGGQPQGATGTMPVPPIVPQVQGGQSPYTAPRPATPPTKGTPPEWQTLNAQVASRAPERQSDQLHFLQEERAKETDPQNQAALDREIARAGGQGMNMMRAGAAMGAMGMHGGQALSQYGQALNEEPRKQAAEVRAERAEVRADKKFDMEARAEANKGDDRNAKKAETQANDLAEYRSITGGMQRLQQTVQELKKHPGLADNTGLSGLAGLNNLTQRGRDAGTLLDDVKNKVTIQVLSDLKKSSANGSSGFGSLSNEEGKRLESYLGELNKAQSYSQMQSALDKITQFAESSTKNYNDKFNSLYGKPDSPNVAPSIGAQPQALQGGAKGGIKFLGFE